MIIYSLLGNKIGPCNSIFNEKVNINNHMLKINKNNEYRNTKLDYLVIRDLSTCREKRRRTIYKLFERSNRADGRKEGIQ